MECLECGKELDRHDTTYSNTGKTNGQHTGDIYKCEDCELCFIDDFLTKQYRHWSY